MNAIIPQRQRVLNPKARPTIRAMISRCAAEVLIEEFGFGGSGEKLKRVEAEVDALLKKYSDNYSRYRNERRAMEALAADALEMGIDCRIRPGSGERVLVGHEHDMIFFCYLMALNKTEGFAGKRMDRFQIGLGRKIRYYNSTFDGAPEMVLDVMDDRLGRYGKTASEHFKPVKPDYIKKKKCGAEMPHGSLYVILTSRPFTKRRKQRGCHGEHKTESNRI